MLPSILGARPSWHFANGWVFEPAIVEPETRHGREEPIPPPTLKIFWSNRPETNKTLKVLISSQKANENHTYD
jgi:hypothetical protein